MLGRSILLFSAIALLAVGVAGLFAAPETAGWLGAAASGPTAVVIQIAASASLGLAVLNGLSHKTRVGGIYARPLCLANLLFSASSALCIGKGLTAGQLPGSWLALVVVFSVLTLAFVWLIFFHDPLSGRAQVTPMSSAGSPAREDPARAFRGSGR
jgi:hypothetical protein